MKTKSRNLLTRAKYAFAISALSLVYAVSGQAAEVSQGVTDTEILIGHNGPQTGPAALYDQVRMGVQSYFNYINEQGGVHGRKLRLIAYDNQYQPSRAVQLTRRLVEQDKVFAMIADVCTPCLVATRNYVERAGIPMVMTSSGSPQLVDPPIKNYLGSSVANYVVEARVLVKYAVEQLGVKRIAIAYQNDDYGTPLGEAAKEAAEQAPGVEVVGSFNFQAADVDLSIQAQRIRQANPDAVIVFSVPGPAAQLKRALANIGATEHHYIVSSVAGDSETQFDMAGAEIWSGTLSSAVIAKPGVVENEAIERYINQYSKDYPRERVADWGQTGWAAAEVLVEALRRTEILNWENFLESFYTFDNWTEGMYAGVSFSEGNHYGLTSIFMTEARDGKVIPISHPIVFDPITGEITGGDPLE